MDWVPPPPKYSTQERATRFGNILRPSLEEQVQLQALGAIESNNNPSAIHRTIQSEGPHQNTAAIGEYGIMPSSAVDVFTLARRVKDDGSNNYGPEMQKSEFIPNPKQESTIHALNKLILEKELKHNKALQDEVALNELRNIEARSDTEDAIPIGWIQGKYKDKIGMTLRDREEHPYYKLQHNRGSKYNEAKLQSIKKLFNK